MPHFQMLVGLPGAGKSTWREANREGKAIISTDIFIEQTAEGLAKVYNEIWKDYIDEAHRRVKNELALAFRENKSVIWDQTNLTRKTRMERLAIVPIHYTKEAIVFLTSDSRIDRINEERRVSGRDVPRHILDGMRARFEPLIGHHEGFDRVTVIDNRIENRKVHF
jgi:predicted kinase